MENRTDHTTGTQEMLQVVTRELVDYVHSIPFDNLAVLLSWLNALDTLQSGTQDEKFQQWSPQSDSLVGEFGGTNCVGATKIFKNRLAKWGIESSLAISPSNRLPEGCSVVEVPFQHVGLVVKTEENDFYLVEPGLGLVVPLLADNNPVEVADRIYHASFSDDSGVLSIIKPDGARLMFDFVYPSGDVDLENNIQKPLLRATTAFKIDAFSPTGEKQTSLKLDFYNEKITYFVYGNAYGYSFDELERMFADESFELLVRQMEHLTRQEVVDRIRMCVSRKQDVVDVWLEGLQKEYYLNNPEKLSPFETSWEQLADRNYLGGGVVVCLLNEKNEVLLYTVPKGKNKPHINRYTGQLNLFVETADQTNGEDGGVATLEDFETNMRRAFQEEIGLNPPSEFIYREVDYAPNIRARCMIARVESSDINLVKNHNEIRANQLGYAEIGRLKWIDPNHLDSVWLEPNAATILRKMIAEGLIPVDESKEPTTWML